LDLVISIALISRSIAAALAILMATAFAVDEHFLAASLAAGFAVVLLPFAQRWLARWLPIFRRPVLLGSILVGLSVASAAASYTLREWYHKKELKEQAARAAALAAAREEQAQQTARKFSEQKLQILAAMSAALESGRWQARWTTPNLGKARRTPISPGWWAPRAP
jgi:uncharacterized membrane protein